jgi:hypothetical protein
MELLRSLSVFSNCSFFSMARSWYATSTAYQTPITLFSRLQATSASATRISSAEAVADLVNRLSSTAAMGEE